MTRPLHFKDVSASDAMVHAEWSVATTEAWSKYFWEYLRSLEESVAAIHERLMDLEDHTKMPMEFKRKKKK